MLTFPRSAALQMRRLASKCQAGRPRGPAPPVIIRSEAGSTQLLVAFAEVTVALRVSGTASLATPLRLPMEALAAVEGSGEEPVNGIGESNHVMLTWTDRGVSRSQNFPLCLEGSTTPTPPVPKKLSPVPHLLLTALFEAGRSTAREPGRYALHRVQIRGGAGEVIGTDAHFVVRFEGFTLPFTKEILVPGLPLFGVVDWSQASEIRLGRTAEHLVIVADDVTVWLRLDSVGRFPDLAGVIPKGPKPAILTLDPADALDLLDALPTLPGGEEPQQPVTLDLATGLASVVRERGENKEVVEVRLPRSPMKSGPVRVALDRRYLTRMLTLGCRRFRVVSAERPVVATGESITTIVMPLDTDQIVLPSPTSGKQSLVTPSQLSPARSPVMKSPEPSANGHSEGEPLDPLVEVEALRNALCEAQQALSRLLVALRSKKKEQKALSQVWSTLKNLNFGGSP